MNVMNEVNPFQNTVIPEYIKENVRERNLMKKINVIKPLHITVISKYMNKHIVERSPMIVINVLKPLHVTVLTTYLKGHKVRETFSVQRQKAGRSEHLYLRVGIRTSFAGWAALSLCHPEPSTPSDIVLFCS